MKILIAEDNEVSRVLLEDTLGNWDYEVVSAEDGERAAKLFSEDKDINLLILDWMMPGMSGLDACREIKKIGDRSVTYIIMLTARTDKDDLAEAMDSGADDYVTKPFNPVELRARVRAGERIIELNQKLTKKIDELQQALDHVKTLQGILPMCAWCKRIRNDDEYWLSVEEYLSEHSEAKFSHSICPECLEKQYPDDAEEEEQKAEKQIAE